MSRDVRIIEINLKDRIKELEKEVTNLKRRLDEVRKAKNTTILKRELEVVGVAAVGLPYSKRNLECEAKASDLERRLQASEKSHEDEMDALRKQFAAEMEQMKLSEKGYGHEEELVFLRHRNEALENDNAALKAESRELRARMDALVTDLSIKEAKTAEDVLGEGYKEWIEATEAKIDDLQKTNQLLRTYLKKSRPDGKGPTLQDPDFEAL